MIVPPFSAKLARDRRAAAVRQSWALRGFAAKERDGWRAYAACKGRPGLFHRGNNDTLTVARQICEGCPVRMDCLAACRKAEAKVDARYWYGTYGGVTANERRDVAYVELRAERRMVPA